MKPASLGIMAAICLAIGPAPGQEAQNPDGQRFTLLLHFNALDPHTPDEVALKVGDLVLLSAERNRGASPNDRAAAALDQLSFSIEGEALEELAPVQTAAPIRLGISGQGVPASSSAFSFDRFDASQPFLRATKPGQATLTVTVTHIGNWKETRTFKFSVTQERQPFQRLMIPAK